MAKPFECSCCGFRGRPFTFYCDCRTQLHGWHCFVKVAVAHPWPTDAQTVTTIEDGRRWLAALDRLPPIGACKGQGTGQPDTTGCHFTFEGSCSHGTRCCPVCNNFGDEPIDGQDIDKDSLPLLAILREINALAGGNVGGKF
jgi:hypothetical protein